MIAIDAVERDRAKPVPTSAKLVDESGLTSEGLLRAVAVCSDDSE
jgi:hypothetical protein